MNRFACLFLIVAVALPVAAAPRYERHFVTAHDALRVALHRLHAQSSPRGTVLFVHGSTFPTALSSAYQLNGRSWMDDLVSRGFDVWGLDFLGYGDSDRYPGDETEVVGTAKSGVEQLSKAIEFIRARTKAPIAIVAHSWGTIPAGMIASRDDGSVTRIVLYGPIAPIKRASPSEMPSSAFLEVATEDQWNGFQSGIPVGRESAIARSDFDPWAAKYLESDATSATRTPRSVRVPSGPEADYVRSQQGIALYDPSKIHVPVLIVRGSWDPVISAAEAEEFLATFGSAEKRLVSIAEGTHRIHLERNRKQLYDEVAMFLSE